MNAAYRLLGWGAMPIVTDRRIAAADPRECHTPLLG